MNTNLADVAVLTCTLPAVETAVRVEEPAEPAADAASVTLTRELVSDASSATLSRSISGRILSRIRDRRAINSTDSRRASSRLAR